MNKEFIYIIIKRFAKAFFFGGLSATLVAVTSNPLNLDNWKIWLGIIATSFLTGGLMALEKASQGYQPQ